jgi:hypothetical protein
MDAGEGFFPGPERGDRKSTSEGRTRAGELKTDDHQKVVVVFFCPPGFEGSAFRSKLESVMMRLQSFL